MIDKKLVPNIDVFSRIEPSKYTDMGIEGMRVKGIEQPETNNFKAVFSGLVENLNSDLAKPQELMKDQMMGNENVDVHDIITAMNKAEIGINVATKITTKVIQTYDKIMQISI